MPSTPTFGWPYPDANTAADVPFDLQQALLSIEATLMKPMWRGYASSAQSKASGTTSGITLTQDYEEDGSFAQGAASYVRNVPKAGIYDVRVMVTFAANATGTRSAEIRKNPTGTDMSTGEVVSRAQGNGYSAGLSGLLAVWRGPLVVGDTIAIAGLQTSGAALDVVGTKYQTYMEIAWVRP